MHGHFFVGFKNYIVKKHGINTWRSLLRASGIEKNTYQVFKEYPTEEWFTLVSTASTMTGEPINKILENVGELIAADLIKMYMVLFKTEWKTLDLIKHCDDMIHRILLIQNPGLNPPELKCSSARPDEVVITYSSSLMCAFTKGLVQGIANYYNEQIVVTEKACMLKGSPKCILSVKKLEVPQLVCQ